MTAQDCVTGCGRPAPDATACRQCGQTLAGRLRDAAGHAEDAWTVIARQTRYGGAGAGGHGDRLPSDLKKSEDLAAVVGEVYTWVRIVEEEHGPLPPWQPLAGPPCPVGVSCRHATCTEIRRRTPPTGLTQELTWLSEQVEWLRKHPAAREAFKTLDDACAQLERLVDSPLTGRRLVGMCDCGQILYAPADRPVVQCKGRPRSCGATWNVDESQQILMDHLDDQLVTAGEAARLAAYLDGDRTQEQIRALVGGWARRGLVLARGQQWREPTAAELEADPQRGPAAVPTYRFGELRQRLAETPRRQRDGAAA